MMEASFLSENVKQLVCGTGQDPCEDAKTTDCLQLPQGTIHWQALQHTLKGLEEFPSSYTEHVERLQPICVSVCHWMQTLTIEEFKEKYSDNLHWTGQKEVFFECFEVLQSKCNSATNVSLLLSTAALERALGDVYLTKNRPCPAMLKDLLVTPELSTILGPTAIHILHILIGPPTSLNLRNILWHGFAAPAEIPIMYAYFLLFVTASLGELLSCNVDPAELPHRPWLTFPNVSQTCKITEVTKDIEKDILMDVLNRTSFIPRNMLTIWEKALEYFYDERCGLCVMLLLPQLELGVRRVFVRVNDCPQRLVTAETSVLFTTFDEMLCLGLSEEKENALMAQVGAPYTEMLMDLLVHQDGPRLRNHLSHGEINFFDVAKDVTDFVLFVCLSWACLFTDRKSTDPKTNLFLEALESSSKGYKSIYHPKSILRRSLDELFTSLEQWENIPLPKPGQLEYEPGADSKLTTMLSNVAENICNNFAIRSCLNRNELPTHNLDSLKLFCTMMSLSTLFRPKIELEVTSLLQRILNQCVSLSQNILQISKLRYEQLLNKELRSRQRKNYSKLISRFLKLVLQFTENMATNTSVNKWSEGLELVASFIDKATQFYDGLI
ncbi:endoplasmic reticulum membrane-associated RNA degradation protein-like isoform X2 [Anneissia japonica]|uniref:endoplasmic reticulum membrane-associated RNA degradation protein-like isoform X2 n=1 Tax=Anneissia japonica TaxID=1529436 RepID=UPI0014257314|nr:endoplasmic reticulum membrane-associated RNA degradation protein-like isoform X2 [Anneissia japonica]